MVKAVDCGSTIRGFKSPRSPLFQTSYNKLLVIPRVNMVDGMAYDLVEIAKRQDEKQLFYFLEACKDKDTDLFFKALEELSGANNPDLWRWVVRYMRDNGYEPLLIKFFYRYLGI